MMRNGVAGQRLSATDNSIFDRLAHAQKRRLLDAFQEFSQTGGTVIDIGLEGVSTNPAAGCLTEFADHHTTYQVAMHGVRSSNNISKSKRKIAGDAFKLPFSDGEFDWSCSNGVIEHMGNAERQFDLLREMTRVSRRGVFVATSNKRHPINFSGTPRSQMLSAQDLYRLAGLLPGKPAYDVGHKRVFGIKAHFFLMISKKQAAK